MTGNGGGLRALENRIYARHLHPSARSAGTLAPEDWDLERFRGRKYCLLLSYRRDETPVPTPVWFGVAGGRLYVRTDAGTSKVKRIRRSARVRILPCTARGRPLGPPIEGAARILPPAEEPVAERALARNYGLGRRFYARALASADAVYVEVGPSRAAASGGHRSAQTEGALG